MFAREPTISLTSPPADIYIAQKSKQAAMKRYLEAAAARSTARAEGGE